METLLQWYWAYLLLASAGGFAAGLFARGLAVVIEKSSSL